MFGLTGIWRYVVPGVLVLALIAVITIGVRGCKEIDQQNDNALVNSGVVMERDRGNQEVINHVEQANDARTNATDVERNSVCSKYDRNCKVGI